MEEKGLVVCDSDILIEFLDRANKSIEDRLVGFGLERLCISSVTYSEVLFGSLNKTHQIALLKGLGGFKLIELDPSIDSIHRNLIKRYSLSHRLHIQDALVAATALRGEHFLYTFNKKDFSFIEGIQLLK
jgi:predicted nucleic acid-binding protein